MKEYSLICSFGNCRPFILDTFRGRYLCLKQRDVSKWEKYYSEEINSNKENNIIEFKNYLL